MRALLTRAVLTLLTLTWVLTGAGRAGAGPGYAAVLCGRIPGLSARQRQLCRAQPDAVAAVGAGMRLGRSECQQQFRGRRWNCSALGAGGVFGPVVVVGSREAAFTYAAAAAGVSWALAAACARGNVSSCGCDSRPQQRGGVRARPAAQGAFKWGGCSADVQFAAAFARRFLDARELEGDARSLMNVHNNRAGRRAVRASLQTECKCHGVSGSCTMRTCWRALPAFRRVGDLLMRQYGRARRVAPAARGRRLALAGPGAGPGGLAAAGAGRPPRRSDLVFLQESPNYCERDPAAGSLGTAGRACSRSVRGPGGCDLLCCGRGYNTHELARSWQCRCKFHWCCRVTCDTCHERVEQYTCK